MIEFLYAIGSFVIDVCLWALVVVSLLSCVSLVLLCVLWLWDMYLELNEEEEDEDG